MAIFHRAALLLLLASAASADPMKRAEPALGRMAHDLVIGHENGQPVFTRTHFTGVVISAEGHVLTALHSLADGYPHLFSLGPNYSGQTWVEPREDSNAAQLLEGVSLWLEGRSDSLRNPRLLLLGGGTFIREPRSRDQYQRIDYRSFEQVRTSFGDFAILKFDFGEEPAPCVPSETSSPDPKSPVWAWGYHPVSFGPAGKSVRRYSRGRVLDVTDLYEMKILTKEGLDTFPQLHTFLSEGFLVTNTDTRPGMSGGMFLNEDGKLVGVIDGGFKNLANTKIPMLGFGMKLEHVFDQAVQKLGFVAAHRIFHCPAR